MMIKHRILVSAFALAMALGPAQAQLFGPSDEEKARESGQDSQLSDLARQAQQLSDRTRALEDKVRSLTDSLSQATGNNEDLRHQIDVLNNKIDRQQKDFAYRLCTLSAQQLGTNADDQGLNCAAAGTPSAGGAPMASSGGGGFRPGDTLPPIGSDNSAVYGGTRGRPPGTLGSLPADNYSGGGRPPAAVSGGAGRTSQFDMAMNLLAKAQYPEAAAAFRAYADANPDDADLSSQAIFWVGNISFVRQDYAPAARNFAEVIKKYPKSSRAPDAMLKLAQSFLAMGQKSEGCTTLGLFKSKYPNASDSTLAAATSLRKTACPK